MLNLRHSLLVLVRRPLPTLGIVATLAVAFAATFLVLGLIESYLLRPLPYGDASRLVVIGEYPLQTGPLVGSRVSFANAADLTEHTRTLSRVATVRNESVTLRTGDALESIFVQRVTPDFFPLLGVRAARGDVIHPGNAEQDGQRALVLSHELWQRRFGGDAGIVGRNVDLDQTLYRVVGVAPSELALPIVGNGQQAWLALLPRDFNRAERNVPRHFVFGELAPGVSLSALNAELVAFGRTLARDFPATNGERGFFAFSLREVLVGGFRWHLLLLQAAVALVLVVACVNVGCLLVTQGIRRRREFAVRLALGVSPWQLFRQCFLESLWVTLAGAVAGLLLAAWVAPLTSLLLPVESALRRLPPPSVGAVVVWSALGLALVVAAAFSLVPLWQVRRLNLEAALRDGGRQIGSLSAGAATRVLVGVQVALALALLVTAGLLVRSFQALQQVDRGIDAASLATLRIGLRGTGYESREARTRYYERVVTALQALPEVASAAVSDYSFPVVPGSYAGFLVEGDTTVVAQSTKRALARAVSPEMLQASGLKQLAGRWLGADDRTDTRRVVVISRSLAEKYWPGTDPLGKRVQLEPYGNAWWEVVGVVSDWLSHGAQPRVIDTFYLPLAFAAPADAAVFVRGRQGRLVAPETIHRTVAAIDFHAVPYLHRTAASVYAAGAWQTRFGLTLVAIFAALAVMLCLAGVYAVLAFAVAGRRPEFGLRLMLGATARGIRILVLQDAWRLTWPGLVGGLALAAAAGMALRHMLFGVTALDPLAYVGASTLLAAACAAASLLPARRATRLDPLTVLRAE
ncbi:ADOP family duplicated permease [Opitutus sp. ER46]|uniref:ADOP family duplicated permease n=1 Tax=Opitutus sp. ER46 TaxID=2161864 RepID=UPI000D310880|nr:ADOP family duplicated permease [Opitutus sp. ER46]PTX96542.1 hypothetical protein DB354_07750 [Opitutus sp. ER46]